MLFTYLAKVLSTVASTASFDKHPQSQERGITLDLGKPSLVYISVRCEAKKKRDESVSYLHISLLRVL